LKQMAVGVPRAEQHCGLCNRLFVPSAKGQTYCGTECVRNLKNRQRRV
jgi:hypothetical protein